VEKKALASSNSYLSDSGSHFRVTSGTRGSGRGIFSASERQTDVCFSYATSGFPTAASCLDWIPGWDGRVPDAPVVTFAAHCVCLSTRGVLFTMLLVTPPQYTFIQVHIHTDHSRCCSYGQVDSYYTKSVSFFVSYNF
jgi:hypothetical protein